MVDDLHRTSLCPVQMEITLILPYFIHRKTMRRDWIAVDANVSISRSRQGRWRIAHRGARHARGEQKFHDERNRDENVV
jgi:hypothetical protein